MKVTIESDDAEPPLDENVKTLLFESVREMLLNVIKHAGVHEAKVDLHRHDNRLVVTVSDNGAGFDPQARQKATQDGQSGFGVFSLGDRIEAVGGRWSIDSAVGHGTRIRVDVPIADQ